MSLLGGLVGEVSRLGTLNESYRLYRGEMVV